MSHKHWIYRKKFVFDRPENCKVYKYLLRNTILMLSAHSIKNFISLDVKTFLSLLLWPIVCTESTRVGLSVQYVYFTKILYQDLFFVSDLWFACSSRNGSFKKLITKFIRFTKLIGPLSHNLSQKSKKISIIKKSLNHFFGQTDYIDEQT